MVLHPSSRLIGGCGRGSSCLRVRALMIAGKGKRSLAIHQPEVPDSCNRAFEQVQSLLDTFISTKAKVAQMYKKTIALAVLETTFRLPQTLLPRDSGVDKGMPRVVQICLFLDKNYDRLSAFDDVKGYVSSLTFQEVDYFLSDMLPKLAGDVSIPLTEPLAALIVSSCWFSRVP